MICYDPRIIKICEELLSFLKSDDEERTIHRVLVKKQKRESSSFAEIEIGFITVRLVYKPLTIVNNSEVGSSEGGSVFIYLPFSENGGKFDTKIEIKAYYSERGNDKKLTANVSNEYRSSSVGPKRVVHNVQVSTTDPTKIVGLPSLD